MKRTIYIATRGLRVTARNKRVDVCDRNGTQLDSVPPEDLNLVVLASQGVSIASGALRLLTEHGAGALVLDANFLPGALLLPMWGNTLVAERHRLQAQLAVPVKKRLWAMIVAQKIKNQAQLLTDPTQRRHLREMANRVKSGDSGNAEARAARYYWPKLFTGVLDRPFSRSPSGAPPNQLLNYGYAVIRATAARALCAAGLLPTLGLHHRNRYSTFCLADDIMEPFRPFVDRRVLGLAADGEMALTKATKEYLLNVLTDDVKCGKEHYVLEHMLERTASSLAVCIEDHAKRGTPTSKAVQKLLLPDGWA